VSNPGADTATPEKAALSALEGAVVSAIERLSDTDAKMRALEARRAELEEVVGRFTGNPAEAGEMVTRIRELEEENEDLRTRLEDGRAGVDRILAKIQFLENLR